MALDMKIPSRTMVDCGVRRVKVRSIHQDIPNKKDRQSIASDKIASRPTSGLVRSSISDCDSSENSEKDREKTGRGRTRQRIAYVPLTGFGVFQL